MPAFPRPGEDEDGAGEAAAWAKAMGAAEPVKPLTEEERQQLVELMLHARETEDDEALELLKGLAEDPVRYRQFVTEMQSGDQAAAE